ncbi:CPBP family intramembrane metalloprotease [Bacillus sp. RG28]|uniref:CPBP family intramembrane metalloprotease n=1 Tax=Gottfriedia endophytica TaxID=2820819 RepID=A0A940NSN4_9BACI|nr:type II CAAX endopeptidase family protein [Gottfriedia endophytica]MBP0726322.1 CPBP family intramembrane metalloprotease [Gottfriedia endophytica]
MTIVFKNKDGQVRSFWKIGLAFILMSMLLGVFLFPLYAQMALKNTPMEELLNNPLNNLYGMFVQCLSVVITVLICLKLEKKSWESVGITHIKSQWKNLLMGLLLGAISILFITLILVVTNQITLTSVKITSNLLINTGIFLLGFIFVAINEELFFRGYVVSTLLQTRSFPIAYIVSSIFFGLMHTSNPNVHILGIINVMLIGFLFAYMFIQTKSLWMSMGYHLTWNFFQGNIIGYNVSGTTGSGFFRIKSEDNFWTGGSFGVEASVWTTVFIIVGFIVTKVYTNRSSQAKVQLNRINEQ